MKIAISDIIDVCALHMGVQSTKRIFIEESKRSKGTDITLKCILLYGIKKSRTYTMKQVKKEKQSGANNELKPKIY